MLPGGGLKRPAGGAGREAAVEDGAGLADGGVDGGGGVDAEVVGPVGNDDVEATGISPREGFGEASAARGVTAAFGGAETRPRPAVRDEDACVPAAGVRGVRIIVKDAIGGGTLTHGCVLAVTAAGRNRPRGG